MRNALATVVLLSLLGTACLQSATTGFTNGGGTTTGTAPLPPGAPCASNGVCGSGICGPDGTGNCCVLTCSSEPVCGATACNDAGACLYPSAETACGMTCTNATLASASCNGSGSCQPAGTGTACPDNLACNGDGGCYASCSTLRDCVAGFNCEDGNCVPQVQAGENCADNFDCLSGICGADGVGHCCATACASTTAPCGATDCDGTGACVYPAAGGPCGSVLLSCAAGVQTNPTLCDGLGACTSSPPTTDCAPLICGANACLKGCTTVADCVAGDFCDPVSSSCCSGLVDGGEISVDVQAGSDTTSCCGYGGASPCQTLTHVMQLITLAQAPNVTINATIGDAGGDWQLNAEPALIVLGWGVELKAPGVFFTGFDISTTGAPNDGLNNVSIVGTATSPIGIGTALGGGQWAPSPSAISIESGNTLYIANAIVDGNDYTGTNAIGVAGGATLVLGQDRSAAITGTVYVGGYVFDGIRPGWDGIVCGTANGLGCTVRDAPLVGSSSVIIQEQSNRDIDAEDYSSIVLTSAPVIGQAPTSLGFGTCPDKQDGSVAGVLLNGLASVTLDNATVQCITGYGFELLASSNGSPRLTLSHATIQNTNAGVYASAGTAAVSSSSIWYNFVGVDQDTDGTNVGTIDLSGGDGGRNTVICSSDNEMDYHGSYLNLVAGISVLNDSSATLNASNLFWDTSGPDLFMCDSQAETCACEIAACTEADGADGMDAVYTSSGTITTTGNQLSNAKCLSP